MNNYTYQASEMYYKYTWTTDKGDSPKQRHPIDSAKFDRDEGYEMLSLVNRISTEMNFTNFLQCRLAEVMAKEILPKEFAQNRKGAIEWIKSEIPKRKLKSPQENAKVHLRYPNP